MKNGMKKRLAAILFVLLLLITAGADLHPAALAADRAPVEHDFRYIGAMKVVRCKEWVSLRAEPYKSSKALARVPLGSIVYNCSRIKQKKSFVYAEYEGLSGYILLEFLEPAPQFEPAVTSATTQKMTLKELSAKGRVVLDWQDFNITVKATREIVQEGKINREILRLGCFIDGEPLWGHIETLDNYSTQPLLKAFIAGTEDDPMVMLYDGGYGLTMKDLLSGADRWTIMKGNCDLGDAAIVAVDDEGTMFIAGSQGPDPVAITQEGRILWEADIEDPDVTRPFEIKAKGNGIQVKYGNPSGQYYLVSIDSMGEVTDIQPVKAE